MANVKDYIDWRGDFGFDVAPFNEVDGFICTVLSTPDYTGIADKEAVTLHDAADKYFMTHSESKSNLGLFQSSKVLPLIKELAESPRYKDVVLEGFENKIDGERGEQFCALTMLLPDGTMVISYRGTDDTIVGWKEDFSLAINDAVPAQRDAAEYLIRHASGFCGDIILTGHSKGGNLAAYAAVNAPDSIKGRLRDVLCYDSPGFKDSFLESEEYKSVAGTIKTIIPQYSLVGVIFKHAGEQIVVKSNKFGPLSHDGFVWEVFKDRFVREEKLSGTSKAYEKAINDFALGTDPEEMERFINELFDILSSTGAETLTDLVNMRPGAMLIMLKNLVTEKNISSIQREFIEKFVKALLG